LVNIMWFSKCVSMCLQIMCSSILHIGVFCQFYIAGGPINRLLLFGMVNPVHA
jgi:hypothetical protein